MVKRNHVGNSFVEPVIHLDHLPLMTMWLNNNITLLPSYTPNRQESSYIEPPQVSVLSAGFLSCLIALHFDVHHLTTSSDLCVSITKDTELWESLLGLKEAMKPKGNMDRLMISMCPGLSFSQIPLINVSLPYPPLACLSVFTM